MNAAKCKLPFFQYLERSSNRCMNRYLFLCLVVIVSCSNPDKQTEDVKTFVTEWSAALTAKDKLVKRFYDPAFEFPAVLVEDSANLVYAFDLELMELLVNDTTKETIATIPYRITEIVNGGTYTDQGKLILTIIKTKQGFAIRTMSQDFANEVFYTNRRLAYNQEDAEKRRGYDSVWTQVRAWAADLQKQYDSVVYFTEVDNETLFYVVNGNWVNPYPSEGTQYDSGDYKMGVVTAGNKVIVPMEYTKVYNPGGSFAGFIEVETNGKRGLFTTQGVLFAPAEFDAIYPTRASGAMAQLKQGNQYGWIDANGRISFEEASHKDKTLFQSPVASNAILDWKFTFPGPISVLTDMTGNAEYSDGVIVYPSYLRDMGITEVAHPWVINNVNEMGMGMTDSEIKFEKSESFAGKLYALISFFMESGADARGYQFSQNDLIVVDSNMVKVDHLKKLTKDDFYPDPCSNLRTGPAYRFIEKGLYEATDGDGIYSYYRVNSGGKIERQSTDRQYSFTKFAKIDESYFNGCWYESIDYDEKTGANVVVITGMSNEELDIMRNEIFAEYGFIFKSPKWKAYFEKMSWYKPRFDNVDDQLTEIDKYNIKLILDYQRRHKDQLLKRDSINFGWPA